MASDPELTKVVAAFKDAIAILDSTEPSVRDLIESELMNVAGLSSGRVKGAQLAAQDVTLKVAAIRAKAIKAAFRHLRDNLPSGL